MARPVYTNVPAAYRGNTSNLRHEFDKVFDWLLQSPQAKPTVTKTIKEFATAASIDLTDPLPATSGIVTDGQTFDVTGGTITMNVADNVVTASFEATP